jgi:hypothetical protein
MSEEQERQDNCRTEYDVCMSNVERSQAWYLLLIWMCIGGLSVLCQLAAPWLFPEDEMVLSRSLILNQIPNLIEAGLLMTLLVFMDFVTPGQTLKTATSEPLPAAIVIGTFLLALSQIFKSAF